jgi:hypothetical protein
MDQIQQNFSSFLKALRIYLEGSMPQNENPTKDVKNYGTLIEKTLSFFGNLESISPQVFGEWSQMI